MPRIEEKRPVRLELASPEDACCLTILQARAFLTDEQHAPPEAVETLRRLDDPMIGPPGMADPEWTKMVINSPMSVYYKILLADRIVGGPDRRRGARQASRGELLAHLCRADVQRSRNRPGSHASALSPPSGRQALAAGHAGVPHEEPALLREDGLHPH